MHLYSGSGSPGDLAADAAHLWGLAQVRVFCSCLGAKNSVLYRPKTPNIIINIIIDGRPLRIFFWLARALN